MAKIAIKSEKPTPFGGIFTIMDRFESVISPVVDSTLGLRSKAYGFQYSEIVRSLMCVYFCGGSCVEDVSSHLTTHLSMHPVLRTCSSDTILRGIGELAADNISYRSDSGKSYGFNTADRLNELLVDALLATGQLEKGKAYRLVIQRQRRTDGVSELWEQDYTYRCILTNDFKSSPADIVAFYNERGGKERIFDDMNNGFGWNRLPKSFMAQNTVFLLLTAVIRNFHRYLMLRLDVRSFGLKVTSRNKAFVFRFISVPAKWIRTSRQYVLNIYTRNAAYASPFLPESG